MESLPIELIRPIIREIAAEKGSTSELRSLALVSHAWARLCRPELFLSLAVGGDGLQFARLVYVARRRSLRECVRIIRFSETGTIPHELLGWIPEVFTNVTSVVLSGLSRTLWDHWDETFRPPTFAASLPRLDSLTLWYPPSPRYAWDASSQAMWGKPCLRTLNISVPSGCDLLQPLMHALSRGGTAHSLTDLTVSVHDLGVFASLNVTLPQFRGLSKLALLIYGLQRELEEEPQEELTDSMRMFALPAMQTLRSLRLVVNCDKPALGLLRAFFSNEELPCLRDLAMRFSPVVRVSDMTFFPFLNADLNACASILPRIISRSLERCILSFYDVARIEDADAFYGLFGLEERPEILHVEMTGLRPR